jgi:DNA-binding Lrp family transcriptional regulator
MTDDPIDDVLLAYILTDGPPVPVRALIAAAVDRYRVSPRTVQYHLARLRHRGEILRFGRAYLRVDRQIASLVTER